MASPWAVGQTMSHKRSRKLTGFTGMDVCLRSHSVRYGLTCFLPPAPLSRFTAQRCPETMKVVSGYRKDPRAPPHPSCPGRALTQSQWDLRATTLLWGHDCCAWTDREPQGVLCLPVPITPPAGRSPALLLARTAGALFRRPEPCQGWHVCGWPLWCPLLHLRHGVHSPH